jgi:hypothetical protein
LRSDAVGRYSSMLKLVFHITAATANPHFK